MQLAREASFLEAKYAKFAHLGVHTALKLIGKSKGKEPDTDGDEQGRKGLTEDEGDPTEKKFEAVCRAYQDAEGEARERFHRWLEETYGHQVVKVPQSDHNQKSIKRHELSAADIMAINTANPARRRLINAAKRD